MIWWFWILIGIGLLAFEAAIPTGLFALFFGISALLVGIISAFGILPASWMQWILFSFFAIIALIALKGPLKGKFNINGDEKAIDSLVGEKGIVVEDVTAGGVGRVEIRGAGWTARSDENFFSKGTRCKVERVDGLTLWISKE